MINYILIRSKRKTMALYVRNGIVEVRAPMRTSKKEIDKFVLSKEDWINEKLAQSVERINKRENFALRYGDMLTYRGSRYPIAAKDGDRMGFDNEKFYIPAGLTSEEIKRCCTEIYKHLAKRTLEARVNNFASIMSVTPTNIKVNSAKTRWGSCSAKKSLNFSWRLIMADDDVIDYVVVHELAHIIELNHSPRFWAIVERIIPDYRNKRAKLKKLQQKLSVEDWD